jgi:hypothetical protein
VTLERALIDNRINAKARGGTGVVICHRLSAASIVTIKNVYGISGIIMYFDIYKIIIERLTVARGQDRHPGWPPTIFAVPKKPNPSPRQFKVGDHVKVSLPLGHIVDATVRAVIEHTTVLSCK